jgi:hypothetical protein
MPCRIDALESYIKGKKFMKLFEKHRYQYEKQHLTQSNKKGRGYLFYLWKIHRIKAIFVLSFSPSLPESQI